MFPGYILATNSRHPKYVLICSVCRELNEVESDKEPGECSHCHSQLKTRGPARSNRCLCPHCGTKKKTNSLRLSLKVGEQAPAMVGTEALLSFKAELFFGDDKITEEEFRALLAQTGGLSFIKGKWVEVDHARLQATLEAYEKAKELAEEGAYNTGKIFCKY